MPIIIPPPRAKSYEWEPNHHPDRPRSECRSWQAADRIRARENADEKAAIRWLLENGCGPTNLS
jgi:hypothetical protein